MEHFDGGNTERNRRGYPGQQQEKEETTDGGRDFRYDGREETVERPRQNAM